MKKLFSFLLIFIFCLNLNFALAQENNNGEKPLGQHYYLLEENNKFGVKDKHNNIIFPAKFDDVNYLAKNEFIVTLNGKKGICNSYGSCPYDIIYKNIIPLHGNYLIFQVYIICYKYLIEF